MFILLFFYVRWLLKTIQAVNEDISTVEGLVDTFRQHVQQIYELEVFYGDDTLQGLIKHAKELSDNLSDLDLILNQGDEAQEPANDEVSQDA